MEVLVKEALWDSPDLDDDGDDSDAYKDAPIDYHSYQWDIP
jgi:hypothetical protein